MTDRNLRTKFKRKYIIEIIGESRIIKGNKKSLLEISFERILQENVGSLSKLLPFPSEKLTINIKDFENGPLAK